MKLNLLRLVFVSTLISIFPISHAMENKDQKELIKQFAMNNNSFKRVDEVNPIIQPNKKSTFYCPVKQEISKWECINTFNPGAVVKDGKIYLLYRADDDSQIPMGVGDWSGILHTSRIGLAESTNGLNFERNGDPVLFPDKDQELVNEWAGGCEDPRIVETEDGRYIMTYTQANHPVEVENWKALLAVATSTDLVHWTKHGYVFDKASEGKFGRHWSKSGSIVCRSEGDRLIATKINGKYVMYWGEGKIYIATSDDLISWEPLLDESGNPLVIVEPRPGKFDSRLVEPGPPAIITEAGISLFYNGKNAKENGCQDIAPGAYSAGQLIFNINEPTKIIARSEECFLTPEKEYEKTGQYEQGTVFIQGLVHFKGKWFLYYGTADSAISVAAYEGNELHKIGL